MPDHVVMLKLNQQQLELLDRTVAQRVADDRAGLVRLALREYAAPVRQAAIAAPPARSGSEAGERELLASRILEPGTGKAIELARGQILRIEQIEGGQCVDFNCFNLHDYKEYMHTGRTRTLHGLHPTKGHFMWSAPPRERALIYILDDTARCNDVMFPRCSANLYDSLFGFDVHTNCHDIQAEAQREYGLTPDDVHDSFNLFMHTGVDPQGKLWIDRQTSNPGDYVDLLALEDVLAVPNVCGADLMRTSNFSLKAVKLSIFEGTAADLATVPPLRKFATQRTPADFRIKEIKADRALRRDDSYTPSFANVPIRTSDLAVSLDDEAFALLQQCKLRDYYGDDDGAALRDIVFSWWAQRFIPAA